MRAQGWSLSLEDAVNGVTDSRDEDGPTREEMEAKADELGIKHDGRTTDAALLKKIEAAIEADTESGV